MSRWVVLFCLVSAGCAPDRGACLRSHVEERVAPAHTTLMPMGKVLVPMHHPERRWKETVCDAWQCPSGAWREGVNGTRTCEEPTR